MKKPGGTVHMNNNCEIFLFTFYKDRNMKSNAHSITRITFHIELPSGKHDSLIHKRGRNELACVKIVYAPGRLTSVTSFFVIERSAAPTAAIHNRVGV